MKPKIYKALSILLALAILVSTCVCAIGTVAAKEVTYYVSAAAGETKDGTNDYPFLTVCEAIEYANGLDYAENDTVNVVILDEGTVNWGVYNKTNFLKYPYTLNVSAQNATTELLLNSDSYVGGKTNFDNLKLNTASRYFYFCGNDVTFGSNLTSSANIPWYLGEESPKTFNNDINVEFDNQLDKLIMCGWWGTTFNCDINITYNHNSSPTFSFGAASDQAANYNGNINFNFKNATGVTFKETKIAAKNFGSNAAIQVINSTGINTITADNAGFDSITNSNIADVPRWTIINNSGYKDAINFTDTAGVYKIDKTLLAEATNYLGDVVAEATLVDEDDQYKTLDLREFGAGEYTIDIFTTPVEATYYVSASGNDANDGETESTAFLTFAGAIAKINEKIKSSKDIVNLVLLDNIKWGSNSYPTYPYILKVTAKNATTALSLAGAPGGGEGSLGGKTYFSNLSLSGSYFYLGGNNLTTDSSFTQSNNYWHLGGNKLRRYNDDINLELNHEFKNILVMCNWYSGTFNGDINITYNYNNTPTFAFGSSSSGHTVDYNGNLNFNFKNATGVNFTNRDPNGQKNFGENVAIQVINSTGVDTITADNEGFKSLTNSNVADIPRWTITNNSVYKDAIDFTTIAGVYKIDKTMNASVTNSSGEVIEAILVNANDKYKTLDLRKFGAGAYTVEIFSEPKEYTYYVSATGNDTANGETESTAFKTLTGAIAKINETVTGTRDTVNLVILDNGNIHWGSNKYPTYPYTLKVTAKNAETRLSCIDPDTSTNTDINALGGKTYFDNFNFYPDYFYLCGNDLTTGSNFTQRAKYWHLGNESGTKYNTDINIELNHHLNDMFVVGGYYTNTFNKDINITYNHNSTPQFRFGSTGNNNTTTYRGNINFNIKNATGLTLANRNNGTKIFGECTAIQVINSTGIDTISATNFTEDVTNSSIEGTDKTFADVPRWTIKNATGDKDALSFVSGVAGKYKINIDTKVYDVKVFDASGNEITATVVKDGYIDIAGAGLTAGTYTVMVEEAESHNYDEYINYRNDLGNTYSKLTKDKELNVVYFGGSVTAGTGSSDSEVTSWRARVGNWLKTNFPAANVTNYRQAIGETGTYLGCYRVAKDVVSKAPDLLFIEYSINDYYDSASYDRAQMQFETIVREVKTAYPNCDIVTILVTNYGTVENARKNIMHGAAQAHEDICKAYNIPSIYVGGALGDALGETWTAKDNYEDDDVWMNYVADSVHPNDAGYEIYYNVIKEFLNNELKHSKYDGTIKTNPMPQIQNKYKYLFDGDITYIDEGDTTKVTYDTTNEGIIYEPDKNPGIVSKDDYCGILYVKPGYDGTISVNFKGTELVMLACYGYDKTNEYQVSVDGGETWKTMQYTDKNPVVIAAGLESGEHTALIKPAINQQIGITGFFSRDVDKSSNILNIADLVNADEKITANTTEAYFDYNNDDVIDQKDVATVRKILLNNK